MGVAVADIEERLGDRYSYEAVGAEKLSRTISAAVQWYNEHAPRKIVGSLTTVANQANYDLPEDCPVDGVTKVYWYPGIDFTDYLNLCQLWPDAEGWANRRPSERITAAINRGYLRQFQKGSWDIVEEELVLIPTPTSAGATVYFEYAGKHEINEAGDAYETIPSEHFEVLVLLTIAELLLDQSFKNVPRPDYSAGFERMKRSHIPKNVREHVSYLRRQAKAELHG